MLGHGIWVFPLRFGLGSGFLVVSFGWAGGVLGWTPLFLYWGFWGDRDFVFFSFYSLSCLWGSRSARPWGWLGVFFFLLSYTLPFLVGHT